MRAWPTTASPPAIGRSTCVKLPEAATGDAPTLTATGGGMILGTAGYMSPVQARGLAADHRSALFSLGAPCAITAERRKGRYVYYHCTGYRGPCKSGYVREKVLTTLLADVVGRIQLTAEQADWIAKALRESQADKERAHRRALLLQQQRYQQVQQMLDRAYEDRLGVRDDFHNWMISAAQAKTLQASLPRIRSGSARNSGWAYTQRRYATETLVRRRCARVLGARHGPRPGAEHFPRPLARQRR